MTFVLGTYGATDSTGWSQFSNPSVIVYVSDSAGDDNSADPTNVNTPLQSTFAAFLWLRLNGYDGTNWWCLLKRGDTFAGQCFSEAMFDGIRLSGATNNPGVIGSYDPSVPGVVAPANAAGARPVIYTYPDAYAVFAAHGNFGGFRIAIVGINATTPIDTGLSGFFSYDNVSGPLLIEDCYIRGWSNAFDWIGANTAPPISGPLYFRRCIIDRNLANGIHASPQNGPYVIEECVLHKNGWGNYPPNTFNLNAPNNRFHQLYIDVTQAAGDDSFAHLCTPVTQFRGNYSIATPSDNQLRGGCTSFYDNSLIKNASGITFGNPYPAPGYVNNIHDNVCILSRGGPGFNAMEFFEGMTPYYMNLNWNRGTSQITTNIICNSIDPSGSFGININSGQSGYTVSGNRFYRFAPDTLTNGVGVNSISPPYAILHYTGGIYDVAITNPGTGYVPKSVTITGIRATRESGLDNIVLQVTDTSGFLDNVSPLWIEGLNGTGNIPTLNNQLLSCNVLSSTELEIINTGSINSVTWTSGGTQKVYLPYESCPAYTTLTGVGAGASAMPIVGSSTGVVALAHAADGGGGQAFIINGTGYAVGDTLSIANTGLGGAGSGLVVTVTQLCENTIGTNYFDCSGTNASDYPDPNRTPASYLASLGLTPANCTFTGAITDGVLTVSGLSTPSLMIGDCVVWSGQTRQDYIAKAGNGEFALAEQLTFATDTQTVSSRSMSTETATFTGEITAGILTISSISGYVIPNGEQGQQVSWTGTNSAGEKQGAVRTLVVTAGGTGGVDGTYPNVTLSTGGPAQYTTQGVLSQGDLSSGTGLIATIVVSGGAVTSATVTSAANGGQNYQIQDYDITASDAGLPSGWKCRVATIAPRVFIRYGGNNTYTLASAGNTANKSNASSRPMSSWSTVQFTDLLLEQAKNNWNPSLTSNLGLAPYIRAGFGVGPSVIAPLSYRLRLWA